jgi:hypothetical protein
VSYYQPRSRRTGSNRCVILAAIRDAADKGQTHMTKLIQICASENDLFGLDSDGVVYRYNFSTNSWMRLGGGKQDGTGAAEGRMNDRLETEPVSRRDA